jgi:hypothetical protein
MEKAREHLTVLAVADEAETGGRGSIDRNAADVTALAPKRKV